ncbi:MAG: hypothetical protein ACR2F6_13155 [Mycobacteriales bacterium]
MNPFLDRAGIDDALVNGIVELGPPGSGIARRLRTVEAAADAKLGLSEAALIQRLSTRLGASPQRRDVDGVSYLGWATIVGSGALNLNPAVLVVFLRAGAPTLHVRGYAKQGLLKQRTARKAVDRFLASLQV